METAEQVMIKKVKSTFPVYYEKMVQSCLDSLLLESSFFFQENIPPTLAKDLKDKRDLGLKKYGAQSFQSSFENFMESPTLLHLREEVLDAINYSINEHLRRGVEGKSKERMTDIAKLLVRVYSMIMTTIEEEENLESDV